MHLSLAPLHAGTLPISSDSSPDNMRRGSPRSGVDGDRLLGNRRLISGNLSLRGAAIRAFFDDVGSPSDHRVNNWTHTLCYPPLYIGGVFVF